MRILPIFLLFTTILFADHFDDGFKAFAIDDIKTASKHFQKGVKKNDRRSIYYMGYILFYNKQKQDEGMELMRRSAYMNYPEANFMLGNIFYKTGKFKTALKWLKRGARLNHPKSIYLIGYMYEIGAGVKKSKYSARYWYKKIGIKI
ncbi:MAG: sel1 repeat family protein [Campylobacterales bacterium]|nr:sel1 repeat family protein [Campylobacterales bacterium]